MSASTRPWIEIGSVLVLVGGLVLVSAQIRQSTEITKVQLETSVRQNWRTVDSTRQGEEFASVLAKSIERPQDLTLAEFFELDAYYLGVIDQLGTAANHIEDGFREGSFDFTLSNNVETYFGNAFAKAWAVRHFSNRKNRSDWVESFLTAIQSVDSGGFEAKYRGVLQDIE
ncbi:MAG TPA: hypothetical protein VJ984_16760 [Xanthomonadales bacterium]|nr:hypothetical protein [Xanthomonadales bacterium]